MKLISELVEQVNILVEEKESGKKEFYIEGVFLQGNLKNRNGRVYPVEVLDKEVGRYNEEYIQKNRAYGELGHPQGPTINLERVSHLIKELKRDGSNFTGKAKILDTPYGNIVKNLMQEGAQLGVSSRGMGSLKETNKGVMEVQDDFYLATAADIVADPSAPDAFVKGIMEDVDWAYIPGKGWIMETARQQVEQAVVETKFDRKAREKKYAQIFESFFNQLSKK